MVEIDYSKLGPLALKAANSKATKEWNSGDEGRQSIALSIWGPLAAVGNEQAINTLISLSSSGASSANGALLMALTARAKKAANKNDKDIARSLVNIHNDGCDVATLAIRAVLPKRKAAKGSKKHIATIRLFADAGFQPAIDFFEGNEDAIDFEVQQKESLDSYSNKDLPDSDSHFESNTPSVSNLSESIKENENQIENKEYVPKSVSLSDFSDENVKEKDEDKVLDFVIIFASFFIPIIGIIVYFTKKNSNPELGKKAIVAAVVGFFVMLFITLSF